MSKRNIVAFSGTHGTGKSFCAYELARNLKLTGYNILVLDELARECPLKINKEAVNLTQYWIIASQIKREIELMDRYDYIISDRTVMDALAYGITLGLLDFESASFVAGYVRSLYFKIFLLDPYGFNYHIDDGIRDMDVEFRTNVHDNLKSIYDLYDIDYSLVKTNDELKEKLQELF